MLCGCYTWPLTKDLRQRLNSFGTRSLQRILGYHWSDFVSNKQLLREGQMRFVTCIVCECQLQLYGHVTRFPDADPAHQILSVKEPREWRRPMGRPRASWLQPGVDWLASQGDGDGQTEAPGVPSESGCSDALLWRILPHLTLTWIKNTRRRSWLDKCPPPWVNIWWKHL